MIFALLGKKRFTSDKINNTNLIKVFLCGCFFCMTNDTESDPAGNGTEFSSASSGSVESRRIQVSVDVLQRHP